MEHHLKEKEQNLKKFGLSLQPHVVVICDDFDKLDAVGGGSAFARIQSNLYYEMASIAAAVDLCLKACFVFNLRYPTAAKSTWTFIQLNVFKIATAHDEVASRVMELMSEVNSR